MTSEQTVKDVVYPTKILFWKRITTDGGLLTVITWCCLSYKDTILKANHNTERTCCCWISDVVYPTKILFWKRITTYSPSSHWRFEMLFILQRYYFESESQLMNMQNYIIADVVYPTKILFWKRITTTRLPTLILMMMLFILQRYYFESESQHERPWPESNFWCCLSYKDTILKANHNYKNSNYYPVIDVVYPTKILFWKRITTG